MKKCAGHTSRSGWSWICAGHVPRSLDVEPYQHWPLSFFCSQKLPDWATNPSRAIFIFKFLESLFFFFFFTVFLVLLLWGLSLRGWWYHRRHSALHKIRSLVLAKNYKELKTQKKKIKLPSLKLRYRGQIQSKLRCRCHNTFFYCHFILLIYHLNILDYIRQLSRSLEWRVFPLLFVQCLADSNSDTWLACKKQWTIIIKIFYY